MSNDNPSDEALIAAFNQNWQHARHSENQRFLFASVYAAIVAGSLAVVDKSSPTDIITLGIFLLALTVPGIVVTIKTGLVFHHFKAHAQRISRELAIEKAVADSLYLHPKESVQTPIYLSTGPWLLMVYLLSLAGIVTILFVALLSVFFSGLVQYGLSLALGVVISAALGYAIYRYSQRKMGDIDEYVESLGSEDLVPGSGQGSE